MRLSPIAALAGAIGLAGYTGIAHAQSADSHIMTIRMPDGRIGQVRYTGDVPPTVILDPGASPAVFDPFAMMDRMAAAMDRQAEAMLRAVNTMSVPGAGGLGVMPVLSGPMASANVCMRSVQITYPGNGQAPQIVSRTAGNCGPAGSPSTPAALPADPAPKLGPPVIEAKAAIPYQGLVHPAGDWQR